MQKSKTRQRAGWIDISQTLSPATPVWPGDPEFTSGFASSLEAGDVCNVGRVSFGLHTGTHAESPLHFESDGPDISRLPLEVFIGPALVVSTTGRFPIDRAFVRAISPWPERLLLKTGTGIDHGWHEHFVGVDPEAAEELARRGVKLIGIDSPSIDCAQATSWPAHRVLAGSGVAVLENLLLSEVEPGWYELVALPLKLAGMEASPVRAALRPLPSDYRLNG